MLSTIVRVYGPEDDASSVVVVSGMVWEGLEGEREEPKHFNVGSRQEKKFEWGQNSGET
jgi:hypothetical protein